jgi:uncharacterized membrane protein
MSGLYLWLKWLHVVSSSVLFGTGLGIAFFMWRAHRTRDARIIVAVARNVVLADTVFTASAVVIQPVTGFLLMRMMGYPLTLGWLRVSIALYVLIGCCWLPVLWLQIQLRNFAAGAVRNGMPLPVAYFRYFRWWLSLGWPAFLGVLIVFALMVGKPSL